METAMSARLTLNRPHIVFTVVAAAFAVLIGLGLLGAVAGLFQRDGAPYERLVIAEHACANYSFASERETCVRLYLAASRVRNVAAR
jgi:hypothetical protein